MDAYLATILADSPYANWRLGDPSGTTAADASGNSHPGTYIGGVTLGQAGAIACTNNAAASFNGTTGYVDCGLGSTHYTALTVEAWIKPSSLTGTMDIVTKGYDGTNQEFYLRHVESVGLRFATFTGAADHGVDTAYPGAVDEWHHIAGTYDGATWRLYYDGVLIASAADIAPVHTTIRVAIGGTYVDGTGIAVPFAGLIDEAAIYTTALSTARILAHYNAGILETTAFRRQFVRAA